jgi:HD-like signal output (HDOD) protein/GGDEF domain-containing protein
MNDTPTLSSTETLSAFVERARGLYTLPAVAVKVLELTASPQVDARALKNCIENDPALAAKLLRVVNSSLFGLSRQVSDLNQALALLGVKPLKLLVLGFSLPKALFEGLETETLAQYWRRALTKAAAAREFGEAAARRDSDEAFIAGLLQDLGQLALLQDLGEPYIALLHRARQEPCDFAARELSALGFDHAMLSARLLDHWGLPETLTTAIAQRQEIEQLASLPDDCCALPQTLHLAELAAQVLAEGQADALAELHEAASRYSGLSPEQIGGLLRTVSEKIEPLADALDLELSQGHDRDKILAEAQARLAGIKDAAIGEFTQAADETRAWREVESLRNTLHTFLARGLGAPPRGETPPVKDRPADSAGPSHPPSAGHSTGERREPGLVGQVEATVGRCRQGRKAASVMAIAVDNAPALAFASGAEGVRRAVQLVMAAARSNCETNCVCFPVGESRAAVVLEDCDRSQAVALARRVMATAAQCASARQEWFGGLTLSIGAATLALPPRNFPPQELIDAAWRCLSAAQTSGGNVIKSIDIY